MWDCLFQGHERAQSGTCAIQCVGLVLDTIKILGTHFSYNEKLKEKRTFYLVIATIQQGFGN